MQVERTRLSECAGVLSSGAQPTHAPPPWRPRNSSPSLTRDGHARPDADLCGSGQPASKYGALVLNFAAARAFEPGTRQTAWLREV